MDERESKTKSMNSISRPTILFLGLLIGVVISSVSLVWGFTEPTQAPPRGNVATPINVSGTAQTKAGDLTVGNFYAKNFSVAPGVSEYNITNVNNVTGFNDIFLKGNSSETAPVYIAGSEIHNYTAGIDRLTITNTGNVGIGTTRPGARLDITNNADTRGPEIRLTDTSTNANSRNWVIGNAVGNLPYGAFGFSNGSSQGATPDTNTRLVIDKSGNVGIGTTGPGDKLHVVGGALRIQADYPLVRLFDNTGAVNSRGFQFQNVGGVLYFGATNDDWSWKNPNYALVLANNGNVGIGTTRPTRKLDVAGRLLVREGSIPNGWDIIDWGATVSLRQPGAASMASASHGNAQLELVSSGRNTPHIAFHAPGFYGANFGLDTDNWFSTQGWSAGVGYTSLRVGSFRAVGSATVDGNLTVSGQNVCRQDGTNCPGGGATPTLQQVIAAGNNPTSHIESRGQINTTSYIHAGFNNIQGDTGYYTRVGEVYGWRGLYTGGRGMMLRTESNQPINLHIGGYSAQYENAGNFIVYNPEGSGGQARLGAAWGKRGIYSSGGLFLNTEGRITINDDNQENWFFDGQFLYGRGKQVFDVNDTYLRLNQAGQFSSGVYTPGRLRVDGDIFQGGESDANRVCRKDGTNCPRAAAETDTFDTVTARGNLSNRRIVVQSAGAANMAAANNSNSQLEIISTGRNTPHIAFHAPGFYGANFGLDTDNWLSTQGWSAGAGYTGLRVGNFRAVGSATVDGNLTVSGQNVCRQDGTNCPAGNIGDITAVNASTGLSGGGSSGDVSLSLNLGSANTWSANQTFSGGATFPGSGIWNTSGNVGIGTPSPGQKLTVTGIVESTSGGFKFPDSTVQTTAAAPITYGSGSNISCSSGSFVSRKWNAQTCSFSGCCGSFSCTTGSGWLDAPPTCSYISGCTAFCDTSGSSICTASAWTAAICAP